MAVQVPSHTRVREPVGRSQGDPPEARREDGGLSFIGTGVEQGLHQTAQLDPRRTLTIFGSLPPERLARLRVRPDYH